MCNIMLSSFFLLKLLSFQNFSHVDVIVGGTNERGVSCRKTDDAVIKRCVEFFRSCEPELKVRYYLHKMKKSSVSQSEMSNHLLSSSNRMRQ